MPPRPTILLFDIDGTLITTGGVGRRAIERAVAEALGVPPRRFPFSFGGMVDPVIISQGLRALDVEPTDLLVESVLEHYIERLRAEVTAATVYDVHAGVRSTLDAVSDLEHVAVGLGTGNIETGARIKLERVHLNAYFAFGGYGSDASERPALIARGAARGAEQLGERLDDCRVVIIGDTVRDVEAAHANGAECVAVATGGSSLQELTRAHPEHLFASLDAPGALEAILGGGREYHRKPASQS